MEHTASPLVSIILPTYNGGTYIARAINSVIAQTYQQWELLIIDDGATDDTETVVQNFLSDSRIKYLKNAHNLGIQKTLNRGLREAKGEYVARIDDDDRWVDDEKVEKQVYFFEKHPEHVLVGTGTILVNEKEEEIVRYLLPADDIAIRSKLLAKNCFVHSSVMFKKSTAMDCGGYNESSEVRHIEDYDLWLRMGMKGKMANISAYSVVLITRSESLSGRNKMQQFKKNIDLTKKYKKYYPNYFSAIMRCYLRIVVYGFIFNSPLKGSLNKLFRIYKKWW